MSENNSISMQFRHIEHSNDLIEIIENEAQGLKRRNPQIRTCAVVVEKRHQRHVKGNPIRAQVILGLPGKVVVTSKKSNNSSEIAGASEALFRAFSAAERTVAAYLSRYRKRRHEYHRSWLGMNLATE